MTTLSGNGKTISISRGEVITKKEVVTKSTAYVATLPEITCDNMNDAVYIQTQVNEFVNTLVKDILK